MRPFLFSPRARARCFIEIYMYNLFWHGVVRSTNSKQMQRPHPKYCWLYLTQISINKIVGYLLSTDPTITGRSWKSGSRVFNRDIEQNKKIFFSTFVSCGVDNYKYLTFLYLGAFLATNSEETCRGRLWYFLFWGISFIFGLLKY